MKGVILTIILSIMTISFVSAAYYGGGFSLSDLLNEIDADTMILGAILIISFALINFSLSKVFKDAKPVAAIVAFVVSLLITWGINRTGFDVSGLFYGIGFSEDFLFIILPLLLIAGIIFLGFKFGFGVTLIALGVLFIALGASSFLYHGGTATIIGIILAGIGIFIAKKWPVKNRWERHRINIYNR